MHCKSPVLLSDCDTHKEIAKENAIYFEKQNYESLKNILEQDLYDEDKLKKLNEKANLYVKSFNWKNCAEKTLNLYKMLSS